MPFVKVREAHKFQTATPLAAAHKLHRRNMRTRLWQLMKKSHTRALLQSARRTHHAFVVQ
jgi:hypothetical protein